MASDRVYYNRMKASRAVAGSAVEFPAHTSERRVRLVGKQMRIGRRSAARDLVPEIDLADQPVDPGVSRLHAVLTSASDGTWFISDPGSANGTFVNSRELAIGERVTLHEGDRINLGAWTVITPYGLVRVMQDDERRLSHEPPQGGQRASGGRSTRAKRARISRRPSSSGMNLLKARRHRATGATGAVLAVGP